MRRKKVGVARIRIMLSKLMEMELINFVGSFGPIKILKCPLVTSLSNEAENYRFCHFYHRRAVSPSSEPEYHEFN